MAYKAKNLAPSMRRMSNASFNTKKNIRNATQDLVDYSMGVKESQKIEKTTKELSQAMPLLAMVNKRKELEEAKYDDLKSTFDLLAKDSKESFFPSFDQVKKRNKKAMIDGKEYTIPQLRLISNMGTGNSDLLDLLQLISKGE
jgi:uncharacterized protein YwqG